MIDRFITFVGCFLSALVFVVLFLLYTDMLEIKVTQNIEVTKERLKDE